MAKNAWPTIFLSISSALTLRFWFWDDWTLHIRLSLGQVVVTALSLRRGDAFFLSVSSRFRAWVWLSRSGNRLYSSFESSRFILWTQCIRKSSNQSIIITHFNILVKICLRKRSSICFTFYVLELKKLYFQRTDSTMCGSLFSLGTCDALAKNFENENLSLSLSLSWFKIFSLSEIQISSNERELPCHVCKIDDFFCFFDLLS